MESIDGTRHPLLSTQARSVARTHLAKLYTRVLPTGHKDGHTREVDDSVNRPHGADTKASEQASPAHSAANGVTIPSPPVSRKHTGTTQPTRAPGLTTTDAMERRQEAEKAAVVSHEGRECNEHDGVTYYLRGQIEKDQGSTTWTDGIVDSLQDGHAEDVEAIRGRIAQEEQRLNSIRTARKQAENRYSASQRTNQKLLAATAVDTTIAAPKRTLLYSDDIDDVDTALKREMQALNQARLRLRSVEGNRELRTLHGEGSNIVHRAIDKHGDSDGDVGERLERELQLLQTDLKRLRSASD